MEKVTIETFRGDVEVLGRMAHTAWRDEYGLDSYPDLYSPEYLSYLMQSVDDPRLAIAAYRGEEIVGFLLNLPRRMALDGREYRAALSCLLVTRKEHFRRGLAQAMIQEALARNRDLKYDFTLFYLETGHRSRRLFQKLRAAGAPIERVKRMHVIGRVLDLPAVRASEKVKSWEALVMRLLGADRPAAGFSDPRLREAEPEDAEELQALLNTCRHKVRLARIFTRQEVLRELLCPPLARTLIWEKQGKIAGVLAYVVVRHIGKRPVPWAWINHVVWDGLEFGERRAMIRGFLRRAADQGLAGVVEWSKKTYPTAALYAERFLPYPRQVDMMAWRFREDLRLADIPAVAEVQI